LFHFKFTSLLLHPYCDIYIPTTIAFAVAFALCPDQEIDMIVFSFSSPAKEQTTQTTPSTDRGS